jgi:putative membrane protein
MTAVHYWGPGPWILVFPLFWFAVIATFFWLFRGRRGWGPPHYRGPSALEILDRRFAEGELTAQEYRDRRQVLDRKEENP